MMIYADNTQFKEPHYPISLRSISEQDLDAIIALSVFSIPMIEAEVVHDS